MKSKIVFFVCFNSTTRAASSVGGSRNKDSCFAVLRYYLGSFSPENAPKNGGRFHHRRGRLYIQFSNKTHNLLTSASHPHARRKRSFVRSRADSYRSEGHEDFASCAAVHRYLTNQKEHRDRERRQDLRHARHASVLHISFRVLSAEQDSPSGYCRRCRKFPSLFRDNFSSPRTQFVGVGFRLGAMDATADRKESRSNEVNGRCRTVTMNLNSCA